MYWFGFAYLTEGRLILRVSRFRGLNPGSTEESITKLRMSSPAPASSTSDKVIWATASAFRMWCPRTPVCACPASRSASLIPMRAVSHAGANPNVRPVSKETAVVKTTMRQSRWIGLMWSVLGISSTIAESVHWAPRIPSVPPKIASTRLSVSDCRTIRQRLAPSAARTAISRSRLEARERSRFDTFAQVIRSTKPTAPSKTARVGRIALERSSRTGTKFTPHPVSKSGYTFVKLATRPFISVCACVRLTPGLSLPIALIQRPRGAQSSSLHP